MNASYTLSSSPDQATPADFIIRYKQAQPGEITSNKNSRVIQPRSRSAGIGGYSNFYQQSGIGGHIKERKDSGIGKVCLPDEDSESGSGARRFSFRRIVSMTNVASLRRGSQASQASQASKASQTSQASKASQEGSQE
ncbi:hypothetical protein GQ54DRAFT_310208 [Martensiomyces pterosporus]|nr:hypothetical protein GQ54DRAFT_310208 [Martensiomyces pterosporus]